MPHVELPHYEFKVVMLGDTCTGKTSLVLRFAEGYYRDTSRNPTVGAFFITKRLTVQGLTAKIQIWDTAGSEKFRRLAPMYYKNAAAAIICYDVTSPKSFETLEYWMSQLQQNIAAGNIVIALCATKCDLSMNPDTSQAEALAAETGAMFMTTSAKANSNVHLLFQKVTERVLDRRNVGLELNIPVTLATTAIETRSPNYDNNKIHSSSNQKLPPSPSRNNEFNSIPPLTNRSNTSGGLQFSTTPENGEDNGNSQFVDGNEIEQDADNHEVLDTSNVVLVDNSTSKDSNIKLSGCDANMLMCGDVVGEDGSINACIVQ